ncbi:hypothetical protein TNCV_3201001 [Trichonephila clavipes]|nr:hypothetical protein TNCV_3201001 [Trichonephila clavipes]
MNTDTNRKASVVQIVETSNIEKTKPSVKNPTPSSLLSRPRREIEQNKRSTVKSKKIPRGFGMRFLKVRWTNKKPAGSPWGSGTSLVKKSSAEEGFRWFGQKSLT